MKADPHVDANHFYCFVFAVLICRCVDSVKNLKTYNNNHKQHSLFDVNIYILYRFRKMRYDSPCHEHNTTILTLICKLTKSHNELILYVLGSCIRLVTAQTLSALVNTDTSLSEGSRQSTPCEAVAGGHRRPFLGSHQKSSATSSSFPRKQTLHYLSLAPLISSLLPLYK